MKDLPSPRQLRYLDALAEHLHFGRAATACAVTQSAFSAGIAELEAILGLRLVERTRRRVLMTPLGLEIVERARRLLRDTEDLVELARSRAEPLAGELRLGVIPTVGPYLLPRAVPLLRKSHPRLQLYLREEQTATLIAQIESGQLDAAILALPYELGALETMRLAIDEIVVACPARHRLARLAKVSPRALEAEPLLLLEDGHCLREHALQACALTSRARREVFQATSLRTLVPMIASGLGVTLLPALALAHELPAGGRLVTRPLDTGAVAREIVLAWRRTSARGAEFQLLGQAIKRALPRKPGRAPRVVGG